jgi:hypothetical protein
MRALCFDGGMIFFGPTAELEKSEHPHTKEFLAMDRVVRVRCGVANIGSFRFVWKYRISRQGLRGWKTGRDAAGAARVIAFF